MSPPSGAERDELKRRTAELKQREQQLRARRDELAKQVAQEHWNLGGLAYEMAARDHFRLDLLVKRAAKLQEYDMELAEVDGKLKEVAAATPAPPAPAGAGSGKATGLWQNTTVLWASLLAVCLALGVGVGALTASKTSGSATSSTAPRAVAAQPVAPATSLQTQSTVSSTSASVSAATSRSANAAGHKKTTATAGSKRAANSAHKVASTRAGAETKSGAHAPAPGAPATSLPAIKHVFVIMLSDEPYANVFGPESKLTYLARKLEPKGELLVRYYGVAHEQLAGEIALISGQGPTAQTQTNCPTYTAITPATAGAYGQVLGQGCVFPHSTETIGDQLTAKGLTWRAYVQGLKAPSSGSRGACLHPALGAADPTATPTATGAAATFLDPFLYFQSVTGSPTCASHNVALAALHADLAKESSTPALSYIVPDRCDDAAPAPCAPGQSAGPADAETFLKKVVTEILASQAYRKDGLVVITTDQAPATGEYADSSACCGQPTFPNVPTSVGRSVRYCFRRLSRAARSRRIPTTRSRCCARLRTCLVWRTSATPRCPKSAPLPPLCSRPLPAGPSFTAGLRSERLRAARVW
jgi:hypothetical protein